MKIGDIEGSSVEIELGLDTFGDITADSDGNRLTAADTLRNLVVQGIFADQVGVDVFGVGEHHRDDFAVSAPEVVLAAIAARTQRIRLGSAVTVLSSDDPIRVFERFSTLAALSSGRAEVILGRGSFTESFPLFGYDLADYEELFTGKLALFDQLRTGEPVSWSGSTRGVRSDYQLTGQIVYPQLETAPLPTWIAVGGSPESVVRAASHQLPLMLAIIGGDPLRFKPYADLYRRALAELDKPLLPVGVHSPGHVADTDEQAREELWPHYRAPRSRGSAANAGGHRRRGLSSTGPRVLAARYTSAHPKRSRSRLPTPHPRWASHGSTSSTPTAPSDMTN